MPASPRTKRSQKSEIRKLRKRRRKRRILAASASLNRLSGHDDRRRQSNRVCRWISFSFRWRGSEREELTARNIGGEAAQDDSSVPSYPPKQSQGRTRRS